MDIQISLEDSTPIYVQIVEGVRRGITSGRLRPGEELDPIRTLADRLGVNASTVARAYRELEREGLIATLSTKGTYISPKVDLALVRQMRLKKITDLIDKLVEEARRDNIGIEDVIRLLRERCNDK